MCRSVCAALLLATLIIVPSSSRAQQSQQEDNNGGQQAEATDTAVPIAVDPGTPVDPMQPPVAYESATLPKDRVEAWAMLVAATGLHGVTIPLYLKVSFKTYDTEGKAGLDGTYEYTWLDRNHWSVRWAEGSKLWLRWKTAKGIYAPPGQDSFLDYPETLIPHQIFAPLGNEKLPPYLADENFSSMTLSCFRSSPLAGSTFAGSGIPAAPSSRICTVKAHPILRFIQSENAVYFNKSAVFAHRIVAQMINVRENDRPVVDIDIEQLRSPTPQESAAIQPPTTAELVQDTTLFLPETVSRGRIVKKEEPRYPEAMRRARVQGIVRLSVEVDEGGNVHILRVLSTPDPALTRSAEDAVAKWQYAPFLKDGKPVSLRTTIRVTYTMSQR